MNQAKFLRSTKSIIIINTAPNVKIKPNKKGLIPTNKPDLIWKGNCFRFVVFTSDSFGHSGAEWLHAHLSNMDSLWAFGGNLPPVVFLQRSQVALLSRLPLTSSLWFKPFWCTRVDYLVPTCPGLRTPFRCSTGGPDMVQIPVRLIWLGCLVGTVKGCHAGMHDSIPGEESTIAMGAITISMACN